MHTPAIVSASALPAARLAQQHPADPRPLPAPGRAVSNPRESNRSVASTDRLGAEMPKKPLLLLGDVRVGEVCPGSEGGVVVEQQRHDPDDAARYVGPRAAWDRARRQGTPAVRGDKRPSTRAPRRTAGTRRRPRSPLAGSASSAISSRAGRPVARSRSIRANAAKTSIAAKTCENSSVENGSTIVPGGRPRPQPRAVAGLETILPPATRAASATAPEAPSSHSADEVDHLVFAAQSLRAARERRAARALQHLVERVRVDPSSPAPGPSTSGPCRRPCPRGFLGP